MLGSSLCLNRVLCCKGIEWDIFPVKTIFSSNLGILSVVQNVPSTHVFFWPGTYFHWRLASNTGQDKHLFVKKLQNWNHFKFCRNIETTLFTYLPLRTKTGSYSCLRQSSCQPVLSYTLKKISASSNDAP